MEGNNFLPMSKRRNEVNTTMDPVILNVFAIQSRFVLEILIKLLVNITFNGFPVFFAV